MAAIHNTNYYEMALVHPKAGQHSPQIYRNYRDGLDAIDKDGCVPVPEEPGLGVQIDWDYIAKHNGGYAEYD